MRLAQSLRRSAERHAAPEPEGRDAWLDRSKSIEDLWRNARSPLWVLHAANIADRPVRSIMDAGTRAFAGALEGYEDDLPQMLDYGSLVPESRSIDTYFDWMDQPLEDLTEGVVRYEREAELQRSHVATMKRGKLSPSPYRDGSRGPDEALAKFHRLVATQFWFVAAVHASDLSARKASVCEALGVCLAHAFAARPSRHDALLATLVNAFAG